MRASSSAGASARADGPPVGRGGHRTGPRLVFGAVTFAATRFLDTIELALRQLQERPESFPLVHGTLRRALLPRYPFGVYFQADTEAVRVVAVVHSRRHPRRWIRRRET